MTPPLKFQSMIWIIFILPYFSTIPTFLCLVLLLKYTKTQELQEAKALFIQSMIWLHNVILWYYWKTQELQVALLPELTSFKVGMTSINYVILWFIITNTTKIVPGFTLKIHETPRALGVGGGGVLPWPPAGLRPGSIGTLTAAPHLLPKQSYTCPLPKSCIRIWYIND